MALSVTSASVDTTGKILTVNIGGGTNPILPATGVTGFTVKAFGVTMAQSSATASGGAVTINLTGTIDDVESVTLDYSSSTGNVHDSAGTPLTLGSFTGQAVTNGSTVTTTQNLVVSSASVAADGKTITFAIGGTGKTLPLNPQTGSGNVHGFVVYDDGSAVAVGSAYVSSSNVVLVLSEPVSSGGTLTWDYTPVASGGSGNISDSATTVNILHRYAGQGITNSSAQGPDLAQALAGAVNSQTNRLTWTFPPDATAIKIYKDGSGTALATVNSPTTHYDDVVTDGLAHYYRVATVDTNNHVGSLSGEIIFPVAATIKAQPDDTVSPTTGASVEADKNVVASTLDTAQILQAQDRTIATGFGEPTE